MPAFELLQHRLDAVEGVAQYRQQRLALFGQIQPARQAAEQLNAQLFFQHAHLLADGGLGDTQLQTGAGEVQVASGGFERPQGVEGKSIAHCR